MILQNIPQSISSARAACRKPRSSHVMYNNFESKSPREPFCGSSRKQGCIIKVGVSPTKNVEHI